MDLEPAVQAWNSDGFVILPGFIPADDLAPVVRDLDKVFPSADGFHDGTDERRARYIGDEFDGIDSFPFGSVELSLMAVHPKVIALAEALLGENDLQLYGAESWAKYTGANDYDQDLHRDYLNHTVLVPTSTQGCQQVEMFVFLNDVPETLGPPHLVPRKHTEHLPPVPNWFLRPGLSARGGRFVKTEGNEDLYAAEVSGAGPAGTVIAFDPGTVHRGTRLSEPRGARYSMQLCYRPSNVQWAHRVGWAVQSYSDEWVSFVNRATPRQLELVGFPKAGHPYWTNETLAGMALRYPELDLTHWRNPA